MWKCSNCDEYFDEPEYGNDWVYRCPYCGCSDIVFLDVPILWM
jgi:DNA-directed RNA polymerase subunit RPC12/RpoP